MGRKAEPINVVTMKGRKHLTKAEIEARRSAEESVKPRADKIKPPAWLNKTAKKEFRRIAELLAEVDLITNVDINALAAYCDAYADYVECTRIIDEEGLMVEYTNKAAETNKVPHPLLTKKKQLHEQMRSLALEFGLTPAARARLAKPKEKPKEQSEFERMFGEV